MNFSFRKEHRVTAGGPFKLPIGDPASLSIQPAGSMVFSPIDNFVYISDGLNWDRVSGVNNPVDLLLPITRNKMAKWAEDYPPGGDYLNPVMQDSSLEIDDDGNSILMDTGNTPSAFPWSNANLMTHGSLVSSYTFGMSLDPSDPVSFTPVITQTKGPSDDNPEAADPTTPRTRERYDNGSIAVGHAAMEHIINSSYEPRSMKNAVFGVGAGRNLREDSTNNVIVGSNASTAPTDINYTVSIGAESVCASDGNVVIGFDAGDGGYNNVITVGSRATAQGSNRIVIGSEISIVENPPEGIPCDECINIQIGAETYLMPLYRRR